MVSGAPYGLMRADSPEFPLPGTTIVCVGLDHKTAPVSVRESVASLLGTGQDAIQTFVQTLDPALLPESLVLATCNRIEVYGLTSDDRQLGEAIWHNLARELSLDANHGDLLYQHSSRRAVEHLFEVAAGLDSLIVGEFEILGQVRRAYQKAAAQQNLGPTLHQLFQAAIHTGKRARRETEIGIGAQSLAYAAVALARRNLGDLAGRTALVIGAGEMGRRAAENLYQDGACAITVVSRTLARAEELARAVRGSAISFHELDHALTRADLIISAANTPNVVLHAETIADVMQMRSARPLLLIDIALPRNIEPSAGALPHVTLYNLDDLQRVVERTRTARAAAVTQVREIIAAEVESFWRWYLSRRAAPLIGELYARAEAIRRAELDKALCRLNDLKLTEYEQNILNALTTGIVKKLLAAPTANLKARVQGGDGQVYLDTLRELFDLQAEGAE